MIKKCRLNFTAMHLPNKQVLFFSSLYQHQCLDNQKRKDKDRCIRLLTYDEKEHSNCISQQRYFAFVLNPKWISIIFSSKEVVPKAISEPLPNTLILNPLIFAVSVALRKHAHTYTSSLPLIRRGNNISRCATRFRFL